MKKCERSFRKFFVFQFILFFLASFLSFGQSLSPNSVSTANLSAATTGPYTGKPNINIPVTGISGKQISVPVSLYYNASGVRVEEIASWVGLSWNLDVGGAITRTIKGIDDFNNKGYFSPPQNMPTSISNTCYDGAANYFDYIEDVIELTTDAEPDIYNASLPGFSAQFFFDQAGNPYTIPRQKVKIVKPSNAFGEWTITTTDGFIYKFGGTGFNEISDGTVTTWHLKNITSPLGEVVNFFYTAQTTSYALVPSELSLLVMNTTCAAIDEDLEFSRDVHVTGLFLDRIEVGDSKIEFELGDRCDILGKKLDKIVVKEDSEIIKEFHFDYQCDPAKQRLWLTELRETTGGELALPPHRFTYNNKESLPGINSYAQDHWGFHNGKSNSTLVPSYLESNFSFSGGDRTPNSTTVLNGVLSRIQYPLGGFTEYTFESNDYNNYVSQYPEVTETNESYQAAAGNRSSLMPDDGFDQFELFTSTTVTFNCVVDRLGQAAAGTHHVQLKQGTTVLKTWTQSGSFTMLLTPGVYDIIADIGTNDPNIFLSEISLSYKLLTAESSAPSTRYGGGIRVKKIVTNEGTGNSEDVVHTYDYTNFSNSLTSGKLMSGPVYNYKLRSYCPGSTYTDYRIFSSTSAVSLSSSASGAYVGYDNVTVYYEDGSDEGKTEYTYINNADGFKASATIHGTQAVPYTPNNGNWYQNGLMDKRQDYRRYMGTYYLQATEDPTYNFVEQFIGRGLVVAEEAVFSQRCEDLFHAFYDVRTSWIQLASVTSSTYDGDGVGTGSGISTTVEFEYDATEPWLTKKKSTTNSDGIEYITEYKYPHDFDNSVFNQGIGSLKAAYLHATLVQQIQSRKEAGVTKVTGSSVTQFHYDQGANAHLPIAVHSIEIPEPVTDFTFNSLNPLSDSRFEEQVTYDYDDDGNLIEMTREGQKSSSIFGYDDDLPMAQIVNAAFSEVAYTGFETADKGNWSYPANEITTDSYTGSGSFSGSGTLTAAVPNGSYLVSMWAKGSGNITVEGVAKTVTAGWSQLTWQITSTSDIDVVNPTGSIIDELRVHPSDAMMTSYTFDPTIGMVAVAGADGRARISEYDDHDRLKLVKDFKGNILRTNDYSLRSVLYGEIVGDNPTLNVSSSWSINLGEDLPPGITCSWNFGDGSAIQTGTTANHVYSKLGHFNIEVTLSKLGFETVVERRAVKVAGSLAGTITNGTTNINSSIVLNVAGYASNPAGTTYSWSINNTAGNPMTGLGAVTSYDRLGTYSVSVTIDHRDYPSLTVNKDITVTGQMVASWTPPSGNLVEDQSFSFIASPGINPFDAVYQWSFGGTGLSISKSFAVPTEPSNMTATLTVTHPNYSSVDSSHSFQILYGPPIFTATRSSNGSVTMNVVNSEPDFKFEWRTKDGLAEWSEWSSSTTSSRSYTTGTMSVSLRVECRVTDDGGGGTTSAIVSFNGLVEQ
ncbi:MAG: PKD domain-containing protein [Cyclobacteriaceae bacterium]